MSADEHPGDADALVRAGLDWLLAQHPGKPIARLDGQLPSAFTVGGSWIVLDFTGGPRCAIWKATGAVYELEPDGAAPDDPIYDPSRS